MDAGTSTELTSVASMSTATANPKPICWSMTSSPAAKPENTATTPGSEQEAGNVLHPGLVDSKTADFTEHPGLLESPVACRAAWTDVVGTRAEEWTRT